MTETGDGESKGFDWRRNGREREKKERIAKKERRPHDFKEVQRGVSKHAKKSR